MAEFKLGRIRFVWKGPWTTGTQYYKDDVIRVGGKTYICQIGHTSAADFYTDLDYNPTRWNQLTDGVSWTDEWDTSTSYRVGDVVKYGGLLYICNQPHTSSATVSLGLEADQAKWDIFTEGTDWKGAWVTNTRYKANDVVQYGGYTYICNTAHTSAGSLASGLETDQPKWDTYNPGIEYKGSWTGASFRYKLNDVVKYGAGLYICTTQHTSTASFVSDEANWGQFVKGFEFEEAWVASTTYQIGDVVSYGGNQYIAKTNHSGNDLPPVDTTNWNLFAEGFNFASDWDITNNYKIGDVVKVAGYSYLATIDSPSFTLTITASDSATDRFTCSDNTGIVAGMLVRFTGTVFGNVAESADYYIKEWLDPTHFSITESFGGPLKSLDLATGSMTATISAHPTNESYFQILNKGVNWRGIWVDDTDYNPGDTVRFNSNAYICVQKHRSEADDGSSISVTGGGAANSRPDQDSTGSYWNLLIVGNEVDVLSVRGDLVYYGGSGPTRLPIGTEGQILRVSTDDTPEWATLGSTDFEYFVAPHGRDLPSPIWGKTIDKPFKTVRYACEQVEKGPRNPNAQYLLERNRIFIQKEVTAWIREQIDNSTLPFYNLTVTDITTNNTLATSSPHGLVAGTKLRAKTTANGIVAETDYWIISENLTSTQFRISETRNGTSISSLTNGTSLTINLVFDYDEYKCERDVGFIVDRLIHDLGHGGNLKMRAAAQSYVDALGEGPFSIDEEDQPYNELYAEATADIAAFDYMLTVVNSVLANEAPDTIYQNVTDDSTAIASQFIDTNYVAETGVGATIASLVGIVTTALSDKDSSNIPERITPSNLINVATGSYEETLPIIVPAYTCVLGSELRSTKVNATGSLVDPSDAFFSIPTLDHLSSVISDIVTGTTVTPTSGNSETQVETYPTADTPEADLVSRLVQVMKHQADFKTRSMASASLTDPVGYNTSYLIGYGDARKLIKENKKYFQEEVIAWLAENYPTSKYQKTLTRRDVGYIVDAIIYDLTYGGNAMSVQAGLAYFDGDDDSQPQIAASIKTLTINAISFLKVAMQQAALNNNAGTLQAEVPQFRDTAGSAGAASLIGSNVDDIIAIITDGPQAVGDSVTLTDPTPTNGVNTTTALINAYNTLTAALPTIKVNVVDYINNTYGDFTYNSAYCRRDAGYLVDAAYYDAAFGSNFWAVQNGISYFRPQASTVTRYQIAQEIGSVQYIKGQAAISLASNSTAVSRSDATYDEVIDILTNGVASADALVYTDTGNADALKARQNLVANRQVIIDEGIAWINSNYPLLTYDEDLCERDIGYTVDALAYDSQYGGNLATKNVMRSLFNQITGDSVAYPTSDERDAGAAFYTQLGVICGNIVTATPTYTGQNVSAGTAGATYDTLMDTLCGYISTAISNDDNDLDSIVADSAPTTSWVAAGIVTAIGQLSTDKTDIVKGTLQHISDNYNSFTYSHAKAERDAGIVIKAVSFDFMFNSNYQTIKAAYAYLRPTALELFDQSTLIKQSTLGALEYARTQAIANVGGDTTAISRINSLMEIVYNVVYGGATEGDICESELRNRDYAILKLEENRDFIVAETSAYVADTFSDTVSDTTASTNVITISDTSWLVRNAAIKFTGTTFGGIVAGDTYYVQNVIDSTTFTVAETRYATDSLTLTTASGSMGVEFVYNSDLCLRDVNLYIDALKWDLRWSSNYKSFMVARYYANAVLGSYEEDMYYLRDGTGIRDQTVDGLNGDLTPENAYGTSRVTAGAYCSLDPGWGPDDFRTWIISRSPYVQGVTTFGNAAVGQKIDGALHNGGNDSMVSNDFTQVISDGIGAWVANNGRAELVSVFTYYSHIGYLCTEGGRIRGTNGNNSYGDFGSVAEGVDPTETPGTAVVDNQLQFVSTVGSAFGDGDKFYLLEFENAGIDYTEVTWTLTGGGAQAEVENDEFRDDAVYQVRLLDLGDDSSGQFGGQGYLSNANTAQGGSSSSLTLAATDGEISGAYTGMVVYLTGGTGVGQYGFITSYNAGTKLATVVKEDGSSGWEHVIPGTVISSPDASTTYVVEPRITFDSPGFSNSNSNLPAAGTWTSAIFGQTNASYTAVTGAYSGSAGSGASFSVFRNGYKYIVVVESGGIDYTRLETITIDGTDIGGLSGTNDLIITITATDSSTGEILEFDQSGYGINGTFVAVQAGSRQIATSQTGSSWTTVNNALPSTANWSDVAWGTFNDGSSLERTDNARFVAVASGGTAVAYSSDGVTWTASLLPASANWVSVTFGNGKFVAIASDSTTVAVSLDGELWDLTGTLPSTGFVSVTYGAGMFVAVKPGDTGAVAYSEDATDVWTAEDMPANSTWTSVTWGNNKFVAVASNSNSGAYSIDRGVTWSAMTVGAIDGSTVSGAGYQKVKYGQGLFMATAYLAAFEDYSFVVTSENGIDWTVRGVDTPVGVLNSFSGWNALAFGTPQRTGKWALLPKDSEEVSAWIRTGAKARARAFVAEEKIFAIRITEPGSGYDSTPTMTITDPNNIYEMPFTVRTGKGVIAQPSWIDRGAGYATASAEVFSGDGYADFFQPGGFVAVRRMTQLPAAGSNVVFEGLPGRTFKLVNVVTFLGTNDGAYTSFYQISPVLTESEATSLTNLSGVETRIRYSQVRLTGHDFLDIGTGGFADTNYPGQPTQDPIQANETVDNNGGRVFFTATDQDGNFRVGDLFSIEQSTGVATLNADAFNISGLQELNLGEVTLGGGSATVTEFSTDPFFTADSDSVVPTQRAIKAFIAAQIGGGGAALNVNSVTAGSIKISGNTIENVTGASIKMNAVFEFRNGVTGLPIAFHYFLI